MSIDKGRGDFELTDADGKILISVKDVEYHVGCPMCGSSAFLDYHEYYERNRLCFHLSYNCLECNSSWTNTKIDEANMSSFYGTNVFRLKKLLSIIKDLGIKLVQAR